MATALARPAAETGAGDFDARPARNYDRVSLQRLLATRTFKRGVFDLASGRRSRIYFNMKATMMTPEGAFQCALGLLAALRDLDADYVGGLEMGAVPLLGTIAALSFERGDPIGSVFVRKQAKSHGTALMIEGLADEAGESLANKRVVLIDDVATTGGSVLKAIVEIEKAGGTVTDAIVVLDREEGAAAKLAEHGIALHALFTATDLGVTAEDRRPVE